MPETKRQRYDKIRAQLENERSSFLPHWRELGDYILPRRPRFVVSDINRGDRRNQKIIDNTATLAARTLRSGMKSGITSSAQRWFRLTTPDPDLAEHKPVKQWLHTATERMSSVFLRSNFYQVITSVYGDIIVFGTAAHSIEEDFNTLIRCHSFPIGSFSIANDYRGRVDTFSRDFRMTVRQIVERFGETNPKTGSAVWENFSTFVKTEWDRSNYETWVDIAQIVKPNEEYDPNRLHSKFKKFASCYYERGRGGADEKFLSEKGYDYFPILAPRWELTGEDSYGTDCPGMTALSDIKGLQIGEKHSAQAVEKKVKPPMVGPTALRAAKSSILPGDITYSDAPANQGFRPAHEVNLSISELEEKQAQCRNRIDRAFYADLILMMQNDQRSGVTAREIDERAQERLQAFSPVLEQLNDDEFDPAITITFDIMLRQSRNADGSFHENGMIPEPPEELHGLDLKIEYLSPMAQAQKLAGIAGTERFLNFATQVTGFDPRAAKKVNAPKLIEVYGDIMSVNPSVIRSDDEVAAMEQAEQQAAAAQQQAEILAQSAKAARDLSAAKMDQDSAFTRMVGAAGAPA